MSKTDTVPVASPGDRLSAVAAFVIVAPDPARPSRFVIEEDDHRVLLETEAVSDPALVDRTVLALLATGEGAPPTESGLRVGDPSSRIDELYGVGELRGGKGALALRGAVGELVGPRKARVEPELGAFFVVEDGVVTGLGAFPPEKARAPRAPVTAPAPAPWPSRRVRLGLALAALILVALGGAAGVRSAYRSSVFARFEKNVPAWTRTSEFAALTRNEPVITGKVMTVAIEGWGSGLDETFFSLPSELRAVTPDEVGTLVWLEYYPAEGSYTKAACRVSIVDLQARRVVGFRTVVGTSSGIESIESPAAAWIASLPRR